MPTGKAKFFNWPPFKIYAIDADTGKPLDPNVGVKTRVTYYDVKKDSGGKHSLVAHKTPVPTVIGSKTNNKVAVATTGHAEKKVDKTNRDRCNCANQAEKDAQRKGEKAIPQPTDDTRMDNKKPESKPWTPEDDSRLKTLKAENKSWRDIAQEMGRPQFQLKARFKEIKDTPASQNEDTGIKTKTDEAKAEERKSGKRDKAKYKDNNLKGKPEDYTNADMDGKKKDKRRDNVQPARKTNQKEDRARRSSAEKVQPAINHTSRSHRVSSAVSASACTARFTLGEWLTLQEDDMFSFGELQFLAELIARDRNQTWLRIASTFFDKTGRKVHPHDIRDKFYQMDHMG